MTFQEPLRRFFFLCHSDRSPLLASSGGAEESRGEIRFKLRDSSAPLHFARNDNVMVGRNDNY